MPPGAKNRQAYLPHHFQYAMMLVTLVEVVLLAVSIAITNVDGRLN